MNTDYKRLTGLLLVLAVFIFWKNVILPPIIYGTVPGDFRSFFFASKGFFGQGNIYNFEYLNNIANVNGITDYIYPYLYPPLLAYYMYPLAFLEPRDAARLWLLLAALLCLAIVLMSVYLCSVLLRRTNQGRTIFLPILAILLFYLLPFDNNIALGQVNIVVLAFMVFALALSYIHNRDFLSGFILAPAALIKVTPVLLLVFFLLNRRYKVIYGFLVGAIVFALPTLSIVEGASAWQQFLSFLPSTAYGKSIPGLFSASVRINFSVAGFLARWTPDEIVVGGFTYIALLLLLAVAIIQHSRTKDKGGVQLLLLPYLILMTIASPFTYFHHVIYIYPGLLITMAVLWKIADKYARVLLLLLTGLSLIVSIDPALYNSTPVLRELGAINLYALLALFFVSLVAAELQMRRYKAEGAVS